MNLQKNKINILITLVLGFLTASIFLEVVPFILNQNVFFILSIPIVCIFVLIAVMNMKAMLVFLLFSRALLDPVLNMTKIAILGSKIGIGGILNFLIIFFTFCLSLQAPKIVIRNRLCKYWIIFLFICFVSIIHSPARTMGLKRFLNLATYMCVYLLPFLLIKNRDDQKFWLKIILCTSLVPVGFAMLDLIRGRSFFFGEIIRIQGTFSHPNILAFYLVLIIALVFYILKSRQFLLTKEKIHILWIYLFALFVLLIATKTRGAWVSCWILFFVYGLFKERKYLIYTVLIPPLFLLHPSIRERITELSEDRTLEGGLNSWAWRIKLWKSSLPSIKENFLFGQGLASFKKESSVFFPAAHKGVYAHNAYLELFFETGIFGALSFLAIFVVPIKTFYCRIKTEISDASSGYTIALSYVISYLVVCFADNMLYYLAFNWYFWIFVGILLRGIQLDDSEKSISDNTVL